MIERSPHDLRKASRKAELTGVLERICQVLELSETQHGLARDRYEAVGAWLADSPHPLFEGVLIYPQGSTSLGTTVRPHRQMEHDVDLVCFLPGVSPGASPDLVKRLVGERLRANGRYKDILVEKKRCWRINYAGEFHLDITPSITDPNGMAAGELVPDKDRHVWKASNPKGYKTLFERRASLQPRLRFAKSARLEEKRDEIEPFPERMKNKGILRRAVQLAKAHRDVFFVDDPELAPISVVITTLAALSYEDCVMRFEYDNEFDLLSDVIGRMPLFIESEVLAGRRNWCVWNETTHNENFAEKWNQNPALPEAFFRWHARAHDALSSLDGHLGMDVLQKSLGEAFGPGPVKKAFDLMTEEVSAARASGNLLLSPVVGLNVAVNEGTRVRPNTFFGAG